MSHRAERPRRSLRAILIPHTGSHLRAGLLHQAVESATARTHGVVNAVLELHMSGKSLQMYNLANPIAHGVLNRVCVRAQHREFRFEGEDSKDAFKKRLLTLHPLDLLGYPSP